MSFQIKSNLSDLETSAAPLRDAVMPLVVGVAAGLGTGALIWIMAVIRFGIPGWFWP